MKTKLFLAMAMTLGINVFAQNLSSNGLVGYYLFNGNINDQSGNNNNGTVHNVTLTTDRFGNPNSAYSFTDSIAYIEIPDSPSLQFTSSQQTVSFWMQIPQIPHPNDEMGIIEKMDQHLLSDNTGNSAQGFKIVFDHFGNINYSIKNGIASLWGGCIIPHDSISANQYYHVAFTNDNDSIRNYLNGIKISSSKIPTNCIIGTNTISLSIGKDRWMSNGAIMDNFKGVLDDIRIYDRALNPVEVSSLYNVCSQTIIVHDTIRTTIRDTVHITIQDTAFVSVTDTLVINAFISTNVNLPSTLNTIKIYPNPSSEHIFINTGNYNLMNNYTIKITNITGQVIFSNIINQQEFNIPVNNFGVRGIYFVSIFDSNNHVIDTRKIVLQ